MRAPILSPPQKRGLLAPLPSSVPVVLPNGDILVARKGKTMLRPLIIAAVCALAVASTAAARSAGQDPRVCRYNRPAYCGDLAARAAFKAKFLRVEGRQFVGSLRCPVSAPLTYTCVWGSAAGGMHQTVVRFADKAAGWSASVGAVATTG